MSSPTDFRRYPALEEGRHRGLVASLVRALFGLLVFLIRVVGGVMLMGGLISQNPTWSFWGLGLSIVGWVLFGVIKLMNAAERQGIAERAVAGIGKVPPPAVQKQLLKAAMEAMRDGSAPSTSLIANYEELCRMWALGPRGQ